jgi:hypothetical protein
MTGCQNGAESVTGARVSARDALAGMVDPGRGARPWAHGEPK